MSDTTKSTSLCSTTNGLCNIKFLFPDTHYAVLTTPKTHLQGPVSGWYVELTFLYHLITYFALIGAVVFMIYLIFKLLGVCNEEAAALDQEETPVVTEENPIVPRKEMPCMYGTTEEDLESSLCSSSEDLYDGKICVICYEQRRNCFFVPCGHSIACQTCAQRIMEDDSKVCPICRRLIHKVRKVLTDNDL